MKSASGEARNSAAFAMSSGVPARPHGMVPTRVRTYSSETWRHVAVHGHEPGRDAVDVDAVRAQLHGQHLREHDDAGLRRAVVRGALAPALVGARRDRDDLAARSLRATMRRPAAWQVRNTPRRFVSITRSHSSTDISSDRAVRIDAGVGHGHGDGPERALGRGHERVRPSRPRARRPGWVTTRAERPRRSAARARPARRRHRAPRAPPPRGRPPRCRSRCRSAAPVTSTT